MSVAIGILWLYIYAAHIWDDLGALVEKRPTA